MTFKFSRSKTILYGFINGDIPPYSRHPRPHPPHICQKQKKNDIHPRQYMEKENEICRLNDRQINSQIVTHGDFEQLHMKLE